MTVELTITLKDSDKTLKREFLIYQAILMSEEDPMIAKCLEQMKEEFRGEPDDIKIKALLVAHA